eukprot:EC789274.1.p2 GENE.EC789274.1~~EC789274.1.p2  ORF type:complete len:130 (-),score=57.40 EC789274.1:94-483(-)
MFFFFFFFFFFVLHQPHFTPHAHKTSRLHASIATCTNNQQQKKQTTSSSAGLLLLAETDRLSLEHLQKRVGRLQNLCVRRLRVNDCLVVLAQRLLFPRQRVHNAVQSVVQDLDVVLDLELLLLLLGHLP